jgi:hypothetical protein
MPIFLPADRVALYVHLRTFESDFDKSQSQMRAISSAWTAAVLAAVALLITTAATPIVLPAGAGLKPEGLIDVRADTLAYLRAVICLVGSAGVLAFWSIDQWVYQRLLHSVFAYGLFVEFKEPELPQVRSAMFLANLDVTNRLGIFYRAQFWLFVAVSIGIDVISRKVGHTPIQLEVWYIIGPHLIAVAVCEMFISHTWPSLDHTIEQFYPELAAVLPRRRGAENQQPTPSTFDVSPDARMPAFLRRIRHLEGQQGGG